MLNPLEKMNIVLAANQSYSEYILTTIKSIYLHNKHIRFYLLNRDYPTEWFDILNNKLRKLNSEIIDIKVTNDTIKNFKTYSHISSDTTFFRYFISDFIEQDKVIYLDADIVVNGSLTELYQTDISNYFLAAVKDIISEKIYVNNHIFNAGMLLINNKKWREHNITQFCLSLSEKYINSLPDADQSILNLIFKDKWLKLNRGYNYLIGTDYLFFKYGKTRYLEDLGETIPLIIHYNTEAKPWLNIFNTRFRNIYWFYYELNWQDIYAKHN